MNGKDFFDDFIVGFEFRGGGVPLSPRTSATTMVKFSTIFFQLL